MGAAVLVVGARQFRVTHLNAAAAREEDAEHDGIGVMGDPRRDLVAGPAEVARDRYEVVVGVGGGECPSETAATGPVRVSTLVSVRRARQCYPG
jgi:hypothetical protein